MDPLIRIRIQIQIQIGLVVELINTLVHEREEYHRVLKCVNGNTRPLSANPIN